MAQPSGTHKLRHAEGGVGPEIDAPDLATIAHTLPAIGALHIAETNDAASTNPEALACPRHRSAVFTPLRVPMIWS